MEKCKVCKAIDKKCYVEKSLPQGCIFKRETLLSGGTLLLACKSCDEGKVSYNLNHKMVTCDSCDYSRKMTYKKFAELYVIPAVAQQAEEGVEEDDAGD